MYLVNVILLYVFLMPCTIYPSSNSSIIQIEMKNYVADRSCMKVFFLRKNTNMCN